MPILRFLLSFLTLMLLYSFQSRFCPSDLFPRASTRSSKLSSNGLGGRRLLPPGKTSRPSASVFLQLPLGDKRVLYKGGVLPSLILLHLKMLGLAGLLGPRSPVCVCRARSGAGPCKWSELACVPCLLVLQIGEQAHELVMQDEQHYSMN